MDNHPIPQDITGFQFKLIGNMTVRQFGYLAAGVILAWITFLFPFSFIIKLPLIIIFVSLGVGFAFVPIDGRPMDTMFINLIRALFNPTTYLYQKDGGNLMKPTYALTQQNPVLGQTQTIQSPSVQAIPQPIHSQTPVAPTPDEIQKEEELLEEQQEVLEEEVKEIKEANPTDQKVTELQSMLSETVRQKEELEKELLSLKAMLEKQTTPASIPTQNVEEKPKEEISKPLPAVDAQPISHPEPPNLVKGSVRDPRGNPVFNILVEVLDQDENPVRAFKTSDKGEFTSATSLPNGKYTIKLEDPKEEHRFDPIPFEATGAPLPSFEVKSIDQREELRRELFN